MIRNGIFPYEKRPSKGHCPGVLYFLPISLLILPSLHSSALIVMKKLENIKGR
jgi:hypothetical protein